MTQLQVLVKFSGSDHFKHFVCIFLRFSVVAVVVVAVELNFSVCNKIFESQSVKRHLNTK